MTNQTTNVDMLRKELQDLAFIQRLEIGPLATKAIHERMLKVAFLLQQGLDGTPPPNYMATIQASINRARQQLPSNGH